MQSAPELIAGRYRLGALLGRGGMGEVREAHDERLGRPVAVKLLHPLMAGDDAARHRFEDEARAAAQLVHPNAVAVFDSGEHEGVLYIVMERLPGRTLADQIAEGPVAPGRGRDVGLQVLAALEAAHRAGVIHRDIKPSNILLTADGTAKVGDFGIAKTADGLDHTATGMIVGTPSYLAPERLAGAPATARSDLYATGVLLYEALTGAKPFATGSPLVPAAAVRHEPPPRLDALVPDTDPAFADAVERAMAVDPAQRFDTAAAMAAAMRGDEARPGPGAVAGRLAPPPGRAGTTRASAVAGTAPVGSAPATTSTEVAETGLPGPRASRRGARRRGGRALVVLALAGVLAVAALFSLGDDETGTDDGGVAPPAGGPALPPELEERVRALEEAVRP